MKITNEEGEEITVFSAEELKSATETAVQTAMKAKEDEFGKTKVQIEKERDEARKALGERTGEFRQFRELQKETVEKLTATERVLYENQLAQKKADDERKANDLKVRDSLVLSKIKEKVGSDEKVVGKVKDMYSLIGIEANTPEEIEKKVMATIGAIRTTEPDLLASAAGWSGGSYVPPTKNEENKSFADTDAGKRGMDELGLKIPVKK